MKRDRLEKDLAALLSQHSGVTDIPFTAEDFFGAVGMTGDDVSSFIAAFSAHFNVDMKTFLWYFHVKEDTPRHTRHVQAYLPNGQVAPYQPVTFTNLVDAAQSGHWDWTYPDHSVKREGWKDALQYVLIAVVALWIAASLFF